MNGVGDWNLGEGSHLMAKTIQEMIDSLAHEDFQDLVDSLPEDELEHYGVLGMKWGVRKDRRTGKRVGKPAKGTPRAKHTTPSVSPGSSRPKPKVKSKGTAKTTSDSRKTANDEVSIEAVSTSGKKSDKRVVAKLNQKQKSKLGDKEKGFGLEDLSVEQLRTAADRLRLEAEITKMLDGPTKDQTMQAVVNRIKLEQEYARLTAAPPTRKQKIIATSKEILADVAKTQVKNALNAAAKNQVDKFLRQNGIIPGPKPQPKKPEPKKKKDKS